jgi:hypothetical protein
LIQTLFRGVKRDSEDLMAREPLWCPTGRCPTGTFYIGGKPVNVAWRRSLVDLD